MKAATNEGNKYLKSNEMKWNIETISFKEEVLVQDYNEGSLNVRHYARAQIAHHLLGI